MDEVITDFLDDSGGVIDSYVGYPEFLVAPIGVPMPFHLEFDLIDFIGLELEVINKPLTGPISVLDVMDVQVSPKNGGYEVTGKVIDPGDPLLFDADVAVALLDTFGNTIAVGVLDELLTLGGDDTIEFTIKIEKAQIFGTYASFLIVAVGL